MHLLSLFIIGLLSIAMSVFSQDGNDDQLLSTFQVDSSNLGDPPNSVDSGNPLISADDTDGVVDENDPTTDFSDRPTEFASVDVAEQENPACGSNLATREEADKPAQCLMNQRTRAGVESNLEDQPPSGRKPQEIKRENWQHERGVIADQNCADGFGVVCCARGIVSIESKTYTHALGDAEGCVWYPHEKCSNGWVKICCERIIRKYKAMGFDDIGTWCLPKGVNMYGLPIRRSPLVE